MTLIDKIGDSFREVSIKDRLAVYTLKRKEGKITRQAYLRAFTSEQLQRYSLPSVKPESVASLTCISGVTIGSPGVAVGKVYFSSRELLKAYWLDRQKKRKSEFVLIKESTQIEDLEAIDACSGIITSKGGYTSHAPIVARYLEKPALIYPGIQFEKDHVVIDEISIAEGQEITLDAADEAYPAIYLGPGEIAPGRVQDKNYTYLMEVARQTARDIKILANADTVGMVKRALEAGAEGIGLCRVEHMLSTREKLRLVQSATLLPDGRLRKHALSAISSFLKSDFEEIFSLLGNRSVSIRLLDLSTKEILPGSDAEIADFLERLPSLCDDEKKHVVNQIRRLYETNPTLGLRGCRSAFKWPDLFEAQIAAIIEALSALLENHTALPELDILVPFVSHPSELDLICNGIELSGYKLRGIRQIVAEKAIEMGDDFKKVSVNIGSMIELPSSAISAARLARQSGILCFGTNDLVQNTHGISRDDSKSILAIYEELNVFPQNPFIALTDQVKDLMSHAGQTAKEIRPDIRLCICGESASSEDTIKFCLDEGFDCVSCAPSKVPMALLSAARLSE